MSFSIPDYTYRVREIIRVIDGDTVDIYIDAGFFMYVRKRIRLLELDTEELRGGTVDTKYRAVAAKERIKELFAMGDVYITTKMDTTGKYGRMLGWFFVVVDDQVIDINKTLFEEGYEKGDTTMTFIEKLVSYILPG